MNVELNLFGIICLSLLCIAIILFFLALFCMRKEKYKSSIILGGISCSLAIVGVVLYITNDLKRDMDLNTVFERYIATNVNLVTRLYANGEAGMLEAHLNEKNKAILFEIVSTNNIKPNSNYWEHKSRIVLYEEKPLKGLEVVRPEPPTNTIVGTIISNDKEAGEKEVVAFITNLTNSPPPPSNLEETNIFSN